MHASMRVHLLLTVGSSSLLTCPDGPKYSLHHILYLYRTPNSYARYHDAMMHAEVLLLYSPQLVVDDRRIFLFLLSRAERAEHAMAPASVARCANIVEIAANLVLVDGGAREVVPALLIARALQRARHAADLRLPRHALQLSLCLPRAVLLYLQLPQDDNYTGSSVAMVA